MSGFRDRTEITTVSNPFLDSSAQAGVAQAAAPQPAEDPDAAAVRQAREAKILEWVAEMRAAGHPRQALIAQLAQQGVGEIESNTAINEADMFAGMMGRPHPIDIDPYVKASIEKQGPMLVTDAYANQNDPVASDEQNVAAAVAKAKEMAEEGADTQTVMDFLVTAGAPAEQAQEVATRLIAEARGEDKESKKRFGFLRRK